MGSEHLPAAPRAVGTVGEGGGIPRAPDPAEIRCSMVSTLYASSLTSLGLCMLSMKPAGGRKLPKVSFAIVGALSPTGILGVCPAAGPAWPGIMSLDFCAELLPLFPGSMSRLSAPLELCEPPGRDPTACVSLRHDAGRPGACLGICMLSCMTSIGGESGNYVRPVVELDPEQLIGPSTEHGTGVPCP